MSHSYLRTALISAITTLVLSAAALAQTAVTGCTTLSAPGPYTAASGSVFTLTGPGDCIVLAGAGITFTADSLVINGPVFPPGGTGIHILATAPGAILTLTGDTNIGGTFATQQLTTGIQDDAANTQLNISGLVDAQFNPTGGIGWGLYLNNASNTNILLTPDSTGTTDISGSTYGLFISGGSHNTIVSGFDTLGDGEPAGGIDGGTKAIYILNSNHNAINHIFAGAPGEGIVLDNSPGNLIYNNTIEADPNGIRARWNSPNNTIVKNLVLTPEWLPVFDLFQGTHPNTIGCNGDYWADNTSHTLDGTDTPKIPTTNQPCVSTMQAMTAY